MKKLIVVIVLILAGCTMTITKDDVGFIVYDGEPTLAESVKSWNEYEKTH